MTRPSPDRTPGARTASFAQEREWFLDQMDLGSSAYNVPVAVRLRGPLDAGVLQRSLRLLVGRHASLRTRIEAVDGRPVQVVDPPAALSLPVTDVSAGPPPDVVALVAAEAAAGFDLAGGPLVRARLFRLDDDDHVLAVVIHHIVVDASSIEILMRELGACYDALLDGETPDLPETTLEYADFAEHQRRVLAGGRLDSELAYWRDALDGSPPALDLAADFPRPPRQTFSGGIVETPLPRDAGDRLARLAQSLRTTPFVVVTAAWKAVLARLTGQDRIAVGTYVANRSLPGIENVVGFFVNTVVLDTDLGGDPELREVIARVRRTVLGALSHSEVPFEQVLELVGPERDPGRTRLFQVRVEVVEPIPPPRLRGLEAEVVEVESPRAEFDLELSVRLRRDVTCRLAYNRDLFTGATAQTLVGHLATALAAVTEDPGVRVGALPIAGALPSLPAARSPRTTLDRVFARQVETTPDAPALAGALDLSYAELYERSSRMAAALAGAGAGPEVVVGVLTGRSPASVIALLGVLSAGAVYLPLDPANPRDRIEFMASDSGAKVVVAEPHLLDLAPRGLPLVRTDAPGEHRRAEAAADPDHLAYVIYTSGSTGRPKGVAISHANVLPVLEWSRDRFGIGAETKTLQNLSLAFDFGVYETLLTCLYGGCLLVPGGPALDPPTIASYVRDHAVTALHATPSQIAQIAAAGVTLDGLRLLHLGGEELTWDLVTAIERAVSPRCRIFNGYGPTENSVNSTLFEVPRERPRSRERTVPIGAATAATTAYVLDRRLAPVPACGRGELWTGGPGVARGYVGNPRLTAERFVPDPFGQGGRLYRTGDVVRRRPDDLLEFLGRVDDQVKVRGFRIEPGEIRAALTSHPEISDAAVVALPDASGSARLVAYVVTSAATDTRALRAFLARLVPEHMVPSAFVEVPKIPLTPNGKVDRAALPPPRSPVARVAAAAPPRTPAERAVARIWAEVLGLDEVGRDDDFFELGGHSLAATRIVARIRETLDVELPLRALFEAPTIAGVVERMVARDAASDAEPRPALR